MNDERELDDAIEAVKSQEPTEAEIAAAQDRVLARLRAQSNSPIVACEGFQALIPAYLNNQLSPAKVLLLEDHSRSCVACRKALWLARKPATSQPQATNAAISWRHYGSIAAMLAVAAAGGWYVFSTSFGSGTSAVLAASEGAVYRLADDRLQPIRTGETLNAKETLRTGAGSRAVLRLKDGTVLEAGERSQLQLAGSSVELRSGNLLVESKPKAAALYVTSNSARASVAGAIVAFSGGTNGARIGVLKGDVQWEHNGTSTLVHAGETEVSEALLERIPVSEQVAWSRNAKQWRTLLSELSSISLPPVRNRNRLLDAVPSGTAVYFSLPNLASSLEQANTIISERARRSPALREWMDKEGERVTAMLEQARLASSYLGDEIILAFVPAKGGVLVAEVTKSGLREVLANAHIQAALTDRRVAIGTGELPELAVAGGGSFASSPFGIRVKRASESSTGLIVAADLHSVGAKMGSTDLGLANVRYLIAGPRAGVDDTQYSAVLDFDGARRGIASWLAAPSAINGLSFVSPNAEAVAAFVTKRPLDMLEDMSGVLARMPGSGPGLERFFGPELRTQVAAALGNEWTLALDGAILPVPEWKLVIEVNREQALQSAFEDMASRGSWLRIAREWANGRTYYEAEVTANGKPVKFSYVISDGFLIAGPTRAVLDRALQVRRSGVSLPFSPNFRALLPRSAYANFSGILYGNALGSPSLVCAYGGDDRIEVASTSGVFDSVLKNLGSMALSRGTRDAPPSYR